MLASIFSSVSVRISILAVMLALFLIPINLVDSLIHERRERAAGSAEEMSSKWGGKQTVAGPFLVIPYEVHKEKVRNEDGNEILVGENGEMYFLPETLDLEADLKAEKRKRGIYEAVLYNGNVKFRGNFKRPIVSDFPNNTKNIFWGKARVIVSVTDPKGIGSDVELFFGGKENMFQPGSSSRHFNSGLHFKTNPLESKSSLLAFQIKIPIQGSDSMNLVPLGKESTIRISSNWKDPSFEGDLLPKERNITENGFQAVWESSYFSRNYPQVISSHDPRTLSTIGNSGYGVRLIVPVDHYLKLERSVKYATLFIAASFVLFFLLEIFGGKILHPLQYLMIGFAMVIFYVLNLSLSEHIGFAFSYTVASASVSGLIAYYATSVLQSKKRGLIAGGYYFGLYSFLYVILSSEDYALLLGSIAIFVFLALLMYLTRKINWYSFGSPKGEIQSS
ncbi:cell envelope integrity protein CreD [Leptospira santarosai]|uniref:cell envelope integrity protein CreD n=1 Tax=Leptospira santarosai TaxID=28183 RepID=UPI0024AFE388|nr:cell envelope integrity protein CreD [Leptospira santarosai]MDI7173418.1 cell envelope integrity protein CreD [Leptospira santarosai]MDI7192953.1 cell envelope integrity protein CreD [Leptospira santarosai]MDO6397470.1 cell envelope integrity protein CreD [Leptospira santarosai]MDO6402793.1 cell envelope integrity protein CreD [Leptospira santarosai]